MEELFLSASVIIVLLIVLLALLIAILIAPLLIWRNTNRTNRLLVLIALQSGVPPKHVKEVYRMPGSDMSSVFNKLEIDNDFSFKK
ncbi:hypothetical protein Dthio_PD3592 [Desulfonatronospira thiodismutans ASO3-1]|uniref:Uncharacterized protein n=1 Tax=Desulfonatronospira thiodismutans ASO3-1 TaxID=555779 RepID=D6SJT5_9BACT|nr:hypothetical protein [Desulfonatronospira thiodismutans]EFI36138.1 hypothetical protein Dthio_PD3592 [Desulfonatronospira thiodismutans ASO3-1]